MHRSDNVKGLGAELLRQIGNKPLTQRVIDSIDLDNPDCNDSWSLLEVVFKQLPPSEQLVAFLIDALDAWKEGYRVRSHTYYWSKRDNISHCFNRLSKDGLKYWKRKLSLRQRNEHGPQHHLDDLIKIVDQKLETVDDRLS